MAEALLLASGGLDSTTVAYWLRERGRTVWPVFFDYGQHCVEKEWRTLCEVLPRSGFLAPERVDISSIFKGSRSRLIVEADLWSEQIESEDLYIPYRTLLFFAVSAARAQTVGITDVYSGFINSNHAKELDCSAGFLNGLEGLSTRVGPVRFQIPFREYSKKQVTEVALAMNVPIGRTFSCQVYSDVPCGVCPNCVDRLDAMREAGLVT